MLINHFCIYRYSMVGVSVIDFIHTNLTAISNFLVVLVSLFIAIWGDSIKKRITAPKLILDIENEEGELTKWQDGSKVRYFHFRVINKKREPAHNALVLLTEQIEKWDGGYRTVWKGETFMHWPYPEYNEGIYKTVGPNPERADLLYVTEKKLSMSVGILPNNMKTDEGKKIDCYYKFIAKSDETVSKPLIIHVCWDGIWESGNAEMKKHLIVEKAMLPSHIAR